MKMGVSRMPIRQALTVLEREGLVKTDRWRGTMVSPLDARQILHIYELRTILERAVAASAAENALDVTALRRIIVIGRQAASNGDLAAALDSDVRFHTALYEAFGNTILSELMVGLWDHVRRAICAAVLSVDYRTEVWDEHERIVDAIHARDAIGAAAASGDHMAHASQIALRNLEAVKKGQEA